MNFWYKLIGQSAAVQVLDSNSSVADSVSHAWLITGPAGSGRSVAAYSLAAKLLSYGHPREQYQRIFAQTFAKSHPDIVFADSSKVNIGIDDVRKLILDSYRTPSSSNFRIVVIEDADRMLERTANVLLKTLEEPPTNTVWILCAPNEHAILPTIRSRTTVVRLTVPKLQDVADFLRIDFDISDVEAMRIARYANGHIGVAKASVRDGKFLERRNSVVEQFLDIRSVSDAVFFAKTVVGLAKQDADAFSDHTVLVAKQEALRIFGYENGVDLPPVLRKQISSLESELGKKLTRALRDGVDRFVTDIALVLRDAEFVCSGVRVGLVNQEFLDLIDNFVDVFGLDRVCLLSDSVGSVQDKITRNVTPILALEGLFVKLFTV